MGHILGLPTGFHLLDRRDHLRFGLCSVSVVFSPQAQGALKGSLVFASNDPVNPTYSLPLTGIGDTSYVVSILSRINTPTLPVNSGAQKLVVTGNDFYPASVIRLNDVALTTRFDNNNQIEAQVPASSLTAIGEIPVTVVNRTPGGGSSKSLPLTPYPPVQLTVSPFLYEPGSKLFYVAIPHAAPAHADTVLAIDPSTGAIKQTITVGKDPNQVALERPGSAGIAFATFGLLSLPLLWRTRLRIGRIVCLVILAGIFAATLGAVAGCGGGSSGGTATPPPVSTTTPSGTYTLKLNATAGSATASENLTLTVQ